MEIADGKVKELWVNAPAENARVRMREISKQLATLYKEFYEYKGAGNNTKANESHYKIKQLEKEFDKMKDTMEQLKLMGLVTDNDATENGALEGNIGSNKETESMPLEKDPVQAQDEDPKAELIKYAEATKDPDYIKHVKGLTNMNTINARLQWHRQKEERNMKDSFDMLKLCGITQDASIPLFGWRSGIGRKDLKQMLEDLKRKKVKLEQAISAQEHYYTNPKTKQDQQELAEVEMQISTVQHMLSKVTHDEDTTDTYSVVHRDGDFKVVQTEEGFEVYYLGVYHDTFQTKEQALKFIKKSQKKG